jgi:uncharacterized protein (DUF488 family)
VGTGNGNCACGWLAAYVLMSRVRTGRPQSKYPAFFTVGYQSHTIRTLVNLLSTNGICVLVDVRQNPVSRKPGFSRNSLEKTLPQVGIAYLHYPSLGTPTRIRKLYFRTGNALAALKEYEEHLRRRRGCLQSLLNRVAPRKFCLLCLESDYTVCHRSVIAQKLTEMTGCQPTHLT